jgi:hypothetical protein
MRTKIFSIASCFISITVLAQPVKNDPAYYETFPDKLTGRVYFAQKYLKVTIPSANDSQKDIEYKANTKLNMGIGVTYHNFSLNIFYGFAFLNKDTAKGESKGLDLQLHLYPRKWAIDLIAAFPKGYYNFPKGYAAPLGKTYYTRPDIKLTLVGLSAYQVPNKEKFSYRAAIVQNEWQKKSAGSFLYGGTIYYGTLKGDSALVPKVLQGSAFPQAGINNVNFVYLGIGGGYAHTFVIDQHFFFSLSMIGNAGINSTSEDGAGGKKRKTSLDPSVIYKAGIGYNSPNWSVGISGLGSSFWSKGAAADKNYYIPAGSIRLAISKKFDLKKKGK